MREIKKRSNSKTATTCRLWVLLCVLLSISWLSVCLGDSVTYDSNNGEGIFTTDKFEIKMEDGVITYFKNKSTNTVYINGVDSGSAVKTAALYAYGATDRGGTPPLQDFSYNAAATFNYGTPTRSQKDNTYQISWIFDTTHDGNTVHSVISAWLDQTTHDLVVGHYSSCTGAPKLHRIRWAMTNIDDDLDIIIPYTGGIRVDDDFTRDYFVWPFKLNAGFVVCQGTNEGFWVHCRDLYYKYKGLEVDLSRTNHALGFDTEADAPFNQTETLYSVHWRVNCYSGNSYQGSWSLPVHQYREWMADNYTISTRPDWVDDIELVMFNIPANSGAPLIADELDDYIDPNKVLLGCASWRYYSWGSAFPQYRTMSSTWNDDHDHWVSNHGFNTMIWINPHSCSESYTSVFDVYHPNKCIKNPMNSTQHWPTWFEGLHYINLSEDDWREEVIGKNLDKAFSNFNNAPKAVMLDEAWRITQSSGGYFDEDTTCEGSLAFDSDLLNSPNMPNNLALAGEDLSEITFRNQSFAHIHGYGGTWIDDRWTIPTSKHDELCPVFAVLFSPYTKCYGFWGLDGKDANSTNAETAYEKLRFEPMIGPAPQKPGGTYCILSENSGTEMTDVVERMIDRATGDDGNEPPTLTSCQVSPADGNTSTEFVFYTVYTDADNEGPGTEDDSYVRVVVDDVVYEMNRSSNPPYTSGIWFSLAMDDFDEGGHEYHFECWDTWTVVRYPTSGELTFDVNDTLY